MHPPRSIIAVLPVLMFAGRTASAHTIVVRPGESIGTAISGAVPGDRIAVMPGIYKEGAPGDLNALTVTIDGIQLVGLSTPEDPVILENAGGQSYGVWVSPLDSTGPGPESNDEVPPCASSGSIVRGFSIAGFTVLGFQQHGIHLSCVADFQISNNTVTHNDVYGIFPLLSNHGIMAGNLVSGTSLDAGIYVGQSDSVLITGNRSEDNLIGIEVENSRQCAVTGNEVRSNTLGIFVDVLPFLVTHTQETTLVAHNNVHDNNRANTASAGDITAALPSGTGILLLGGNTATVSFNTVHHNGFAGIGVASLCLGLQLLGQPCAALDVDPNPNMNQIVLNDVEQNGTAPQSNLLFDLLRADLVWDGSGEGNCWKDNLFTTAVPQSLPTCQ